MLKNINEKAKSSDARDFFTKSAGKVYQSISGMKDDKWNPADIIAVKHGEEKKWTSFIENFISEREADKKNTKENLLIRGKELDAKRNAVLEMKKSKYNDEIETYKKDKVKIDGLNAVQADWDKGKYKITKLIYNASN